MAAHDPLHLPVSSDDLDEPLGLAQRDGVHVGNAALERRMMHADQGRRVRALGEGLIQPLETLCAELAMARSGDHRVEHDEPRREVVDGILDEAACHAACAGEMREQHLAAVVVAGTT